MENVNNGESEQPRTRSPPPQNNIEIQPENEARFKMLQRETSSLKDMMEKLPEQNSEKVRQVDTAPTTSSFTAQSSNMVTGVSRTQRDRKQGYEDKEDYEDSFRNTTETALLNAIQDLPRRLQKSNNNLLQTHFPNFRGAKDKYD